DDFEVIRLIGIGAFGRVFVVRKLGGLDGGQVYAMKVIPKVVTIHTLGSAKLIKSERLILEFIQGKPFLVCLQYAFQNVQNLYLVMNFVQGGELYRRLISKGSFPEPDVCLYVAELVEALDLLHKRDVIYRDLKLENVLIDSEGHIVLADFGLATLLNVENHYRAFEFCGTLESMAPEVIRLSAEGYGKPVDWWSLGVLTAELLSGFNPFAPLQSTDEEQKYETRNNILNNKPHLPSSVSPTAADLVEKLLEKDPYKRLDANGIRKHPFFAHIDWRKLAKKQYGMPFVPSIESQDDVQNFDNEFTSQPTEVSLGAAPPANLRLYRGFNYTSPQILQWSRMHEDQGTEYRNPSVEKIRRRPDDLVLDNLVCSGGFGSCFVLNDNYLVKVIHISKFRAAEVDALMSCRHSNIVRYFDTFRHRTELWIIMEYLRGKDLSWSIRNGQLNERFSRPIFRQLVDAVSYLHSKHIIHGDLKPENIVWKNERSLTIKLVDFGFASYNGEFRHWVDNARYTLDFAPPELLGGDRRVVYTPAVDIYGLGATLYCMILGHPPFRANTNDVDHSPKTKMVLKDCIKRGIFNHGVRKWLNGTEPFRKLVRWCLQKDPTARPQLVDIMNSEWLQPDSDDE
ncbi:hypothetical protein KR038_005389, partial [Drosophila bunnanda]